VPPWCQFLESGTAKSHWTQDPKITMFGVMTEMFFLRGIVGQQAIVARCVIVLQKSITLPLGGTNSRCTIPSMLENSGNFLTDPRPYTRQSYVILHHVALVRTDVSEERSWKLPRRQCSSTLHISNSVVGRHAAETKECNWWQGLRHLEFLYININISDKRNAFIWRS
jgi:hypothetical protein